MVLYVDYFGVSFYDVFSFDVSISYIYIYINAI